MNDMLRAGRTPWLATPLVAAATLTALSVLQYNITFGGWIGTTAIVFGVVTLALIATRLATGNRYLPTVAGAVAAVLVLVPTYATDSDGGRFSLPTVEALRALVTTVRDGVTYAVETTAPAQASTGLAALVTTVFLGLFLVSEHIAVSWRHTATAGLTLLLPWGFPIVSSTRVNEVALVTSIALWIGAMSLTRRQSGSTRRHSFGSGFLATAAAISVTLVAVPTALAGPGWGWQAGLTAPDAFTGGPTRLNLALDLRNSLTTNSDTPTIVYRTDGQHPDALKLYTYVDFDGAAWDREASTPSARDAANGVLWPIQTGWPEGTATRLDIAVQGLTESNLPIPTTPRTVEADGAWTYLSELDEVVADGINTRGLQYVVYTDLNYHNADALRAAEQLIGADQSPDANDPRYLDINPTIDIDRVQALAEDLTAGAPTRYDAALAIQSYFRNAQNFTYDTSVDPSASDAVSAFLDDRTGYCVQFASTMVVMLRSVGIPARMGVGFLPGTQLDEGEYVVTGADAHAWPEVYFPGHGWVRFEPTPAVQTGAPPEWADPYVGQWPVPRELAEGHFPGQATNGGVNPDLEPAIDVPTAGGDPAAGPPLLLIALISVVLLAAAAAAILFARRTRVRLRLLRAGPEGAWERLRDHVGEASWPLTLTPYEARQHVSDALEATGQAPISADAAAALNGLTEAVTCYRYGPTGVVVSQAQLDTWVDAVVAEAEAARTATDRPARGGVRSALPAGQ